MVSKSRTLVTALILLAVLCACAKADQPFYEQAATAFESGNLNEAERSVRAGLERTPQDAPLHTLLGEIHSNRKRNKQAEAAFRTALECDREYWRAHNGLGLLLWLRGDNEQAREHLEQAISLEPRSDVAHVNLGQVLVSLGQLAEAEALYRKALESNPNLAVTHYRLGQLYERRRQTKKAISAYQKSAEILQYMPSGQRRDFVGFKNSIEKRLRATLRKHNLSTLLWVVVPYSLVLFIALIPKVRMDRSCARDKQARLQELLKKEREGERCLTEQLAMHQKKLLQAIPRS